MTNTALHWAFIFDISRFPTVDMYIFLVPVSLDDNYLPATPQVQQINCPEDKDFPPPTSAQNKLNKVLIMNDINLRKTRTS